MDEGARIEISKLARFRCLGTWDAWERSSPPTSLLDKRTVNYRGINCLKRHPSIYTSLELLVLPHTYKRISLISNQYSVSKSHPRLTFGA